MAQKLRILSLFGMLSLLSFALLASAQEEGPHCAVQLTSGTVFGGGSGKLDVVFQGIPQGDYSVQIAGLPSNSSYTQTQDNSDVTVTLDLHPDRSFNGSTLPVEVSLLGDDESFFITCDAEITVATNTPPTCNIPGTQNGIYQGFACGTSSINISASASDIDPQALTIAWTSNCPGGQFSPAHQTSTLLTFTSPSASSLSCTATMTVSDGIDSVQCDAPISVLECSKDCAGTIAGMAKFDSCGICNGNGSSCKDCKGTLNGSAKIDQCGICGGDGTSCLGCSIHDSTATQFRLDGSAAHLKSMIINYSRSLPSAAQAAKYAQDAAHYYTQMWGTVWSVASVSSLCTNSILCVNVSVSSNAVTITSNANELELLGMKLQKDLAKQHALSAARLARLKMQLGQITKHLKEDVSRLPTTSSACS